jgi:hypothetical protein
VAKSLFIRFDPIIPRDRDWPTSKWTQYEKALWNYLDDNLGQDMTKEFDKTIENWSHKPVIEKTVYWRYHYQMALWVRPAGKNSLRWKRISTGVRAHDIVAHNPSGRLHFKRFYTPHTTPDGKWGGSGHRYGPYVHPTMVPAGKWKGIKARHFAKKIKKKFQPRVFRDVQKIANRIFR